MTCAAGEPMWPSVMYCDASHPMRPVTCQHGSMAGDKVDALRALFGVETDIALAAALGVDRTTIAQWRRRGRLPSKYEFVAAESVEIDAEEVRLRWAELNALRSLVYRDPLFHYWIAAVLSSLAPADFTPEADESAAGRGLRLELEIARRLRRCLSFSQAQLGKVRPDGEADYVELVAALGEDRPVPQSVPQSARGGERNPADNRDRD